MRVAAGINAAIQNAKRLSDDASLLFEAGRFPSAASLAILSRWRIAIPESKSPAGLIGRGRGYVDSAGIRDNYDQPDAREKISLMSD